MKWSWGPAAVTCFLGDAVSAPPFSEGSLSVGFGEGWTSWCKDLSAPHEGQTGQMLLVAKMGQLLPHSLTSEGI